MGVRAPSASAVAVLRGTGDAVPRVPAKGRDAAITSRLACAYCHEETLIEITGRMLFCNVCAKSSEYTPSA